MRCSLPPLPAYRHASTIGRSTQHTPQSPHPSRQLYRRVFACPLHGGRCIDFGLAGAREVLARRNIGTAPLPDFIWFRGKYLPSEGICFIKKKKSLNLCWYLQIFS